MRVSVSSTPIIVIVRTEYSDPVYRPWEPRSPESQPKAPSAPTRPTPPQQTPTLVPGRDTSFVPEEEKRAALDSLRATQNFFTKLGVGDRQGNSRDVNMYIAPNFDNAMYNPEDDSITVGRTPEGRPFANSRDVIAHEYSHRIIDRMLPGMGTSGEQGVMHESLADTFAAAMDDDWTIGEDVIPGGMRDMLHPERFGDPGHASDYRDSRWDADGGVHSNNGIPNKAAALIGEQLGRPAMAQLYVDAMSKYMDGNSGIADTAAATLAAATDRFGKDSQQVSAVKQAWDAVGVLELLRPQR